MCCCCLPVIASLGVVCVGVVGVDSDGGGGVALRFPIVFWIMCCVGVVVVVAGLSPNTSTRTCTQFNVLRTCTCSWSHSKKKYMQGRLAKGTKNQKNKIPLKCRFLKKYVDEEL